MPILYFFCSVLFHDEHSARGLEFSSLQRVEVHTARNRLSDSISAVPIGGGFSGQIASRSLDPEIELAGQLPLDVVDAESDVSVSS